ncbi:MAG: BlaI/MecI/CopY family transcriptional regulator [Spirochaetota bacterium]
MKETKISLGKRELMILHVVWSKKECTVRDVYEQICKEDKVAYTTIMTMMQKMEKKNILEHYEENRAFVYRAKVDKNDVESGIIHDLLESVFRGSYTDLVNALVRENRISPDELGKIADEIKRSGK